MHFLFCFLLNENVENRNKINKNISEIVIDKQKKNHPTRNTNLPKIF